MAIAIAFPINAKSDGISFSCVVSACQYALHLNDTKISRRVSLSPRSWELVSEATKNSVGHPFELTFELDDHRPSGAVKDVVRAVCSGKFSEKNRNCGGKQAPVCHSINQRARGVG